MANNSGVAFSLLFSMFISIQFIQYNTIFNHANIRIRTEARPYQSYSPLQYFDKVLKAMTSILHYTNAWAKPAFPSNMFLKVYSKIVSEHDQEIPQSQTADNPVAPRGRAAQPPRDTRKTN